MEVIPVWKTRSRARWIGAVTAGVLMATTFLTGAATAASAQTDSDGWEVSPVRALRGQADLTGVVAFGPSDAWAVGYTGGNSTVSTLTLHWDGTRWLRIPSPNRSARENWLFGVAGTSPNDVWATGYDIGPDGKHRTLVLHWDGARWRIVPSPTVEGQDATLNKVVALSPTNAWAVGSTIAWPFTGRTLVQHWDGRTWSTVASPSPGTDGLGSFLLDVAATSADDVWAVGDYDTGDGTMRTLTERWDGTRWTVVKSPAPGEGSLLSSVATGPRGQVWSVGWQQDGAEQTPLVLRWDGDAWSAVDMSGLPADASLGDVRVVGSNDIWTVGSQAGQTLAAHWNGDTWTASPSASPGSVANAFADVATIPGTNCLWAVGQFTNGDLGRPLVEHHCE
ncbi:hypothetical protein [Actinopolymorpha singaporensis]|uniref:hypothetical protein n=1 Tax=Actinopolymorpha singaporensis TaxID=117157 RepID=UPI000B866884|nr:hypothetical protein [Actinopolymorpha singaporensis]